MKSSLVKIFDLFFEKRETKAKSTPITTVFLTLYGLLLLLSIINLLRLFEHKKVLINVFYWLLLFLVVKLADFITSRKNN
jgi:hypothetical protein